MKMREYVRTGTRAVGLAIKTSPWIFACLGILILVQSALPAAQISLLRKLTNDLVKASGTPDNFRGLLPLAIGVAVVLAAGAVSGDITHLLTQIISSNGTAAAKDLVNQSAASFPPQTIASSRFATQVRVARDAAGGSYHWQIAAIITLLGGSLSMIFLFVALWLISPMAALLIVLSLVASMPFRSQAAKIDGKSSPAMGNERKFAEYFTDLLTYQSTALDLSALHGQQRVTAMAQQRLRREANIFQRTLLKMTWLNILAALTTIVFVGAALWVVVVDLSASAGDVVAGVMALMASQGSMNLLSESIGLAMAETAPVVHMYRFIDDASALRREDADSAAGFLSTTAPPPAGGTTIDLLAAQGVVFRHEGADHDALRNCSVVARRGELVAFVGRNGAGKTTLVNCLAGALIPSVGVVEVNGVPIDDSNRAAWRNEVALMGQDFSRFELTVRDAVTLGVSGPTSDAEIWDALASAYLDDHVRALPEGLDTQLGQQFGGVGMSGGQWQRLAFARIHLRRSPVWILDEPTSAVDASTEETMLRRLRAIAEDRITIVVSHRAWTLRGMDRIYVFEDGRVAEWGTYDELVARDGVFTDLFNLQVAGDERVLQGGDTSQV